jgi:hypothetical protein
LFEHNINDITKFDHNPFKQFSVALMLRRQIKEICLNKKTKMEIRTRNAIKKIAAIGSGALMAATCFGVAGLATDLSDYPAPFVADGKWVGMMAIGNDAATADLIGAVDIAATLAQVAGGTTGTTEIAGGVEEEVDLDTTLNAAFGSPLDDSDIDTLLDGDVDFADETLDVHEEVTLDAATPNIAISATGDADYGKDPVMEVGTGDVAYSYVFDETVDWEAGDTEVTDEEPLIIDFLGKSLTITDVTAGAPDEITAQVGEEFYLNVADTVTVLGKVVKLINVGDASAVVTVDGDQEVIAEGNTEKVNGLRINVKEVFSTDTMAERSASLIIGEDAFKTYADGNDFIIPCATPMTEDCDEDSPDWVWVIDMDNAGGTDTLGIVNDFTWNNDEDPVIAVGETLDFPDNYVWIQPKSLTVTDFGAYKIYFDDGIDLTDAEGGEDDETVFIIKGPSDDSLEIAGFETNTIYLWVDAGAAEINAYYKDDDGDITDSGLATADGDDADEDGVFFDFVYGDTTMRADVYAAAGAQPVLAIAVASGGDIGDLNTDAGDMYIAITTDDDLAGAPTIFEGMNTPEEAEATDVVLDYAANTEIGERDNPVLFAYGDYIATPEDTTDVDEVDLYVPDDQQTVNTLIGSTGTKVTVTGGAGTMSGVPIAKLDIEITDAKAQNLILVGGTAVNKLTAEALGVTYPTYGTDAGAVLGIAANQATLKLVENAFGGTNVALIVAGWEAADTRNAANVLKDYSAYSATLTGKQVVVTSTAGTITLSAPTVAAPIIPVLPIGNETV